MKFVGELLQRQLALYPKMELDDIYKVLYQAALGPEHAVQDAVAARARLQVEAASLGAGGAEPLCEPLSPDGKLGRVNLRPYVAANHDLEALAEAFVQTAASYPGSREKLGRFCGCLGDLAAAGGIPFTRDAVVGYFDLIAARAYPAVHHSSAYRNAYQPAYRVVAFDLLPAVRTPS